MEELRSTSGQSATKRRCYRPQFSLLTILIITSLAALILGVNFWPPKITGGYSNVFGGDFREDSYCFRAQCGWPFKHLDATSGSCHEREATLVDARGWPVGKPAPPRVTNWYKLAANIAVLSALTAIAWWLARWLWDICRAAAKLLRESGQRHKLKLFAITAILCLIGSTIMIWGAMTRRHSYHVADYLLTWGYDSGISSWAFKWLLFPPLFIAAGMLMLAAARDWLQGSDRKVKITMIACAVILLLVVLDATGRSLVDYYVFDMIRHR